MAKLTQKRGKAFGPLGLANTPQNKKVKLNSKLANREEEHQYTFDSETQVPLTNAACRDVRIDASYQHMREG
jgi:hypothetical protein